MKKAYVAPVLEFERFELDASIAAGCGTIVDMGPEGGPANTTCESYYDEIGVPMPTTTYSMVPRSFWVVETCNCYTTAGGELFFTS